MAGVTLADLTAAIGKLTTDTNLKIVRTIPNTPFKVPPVSQLPTEIQCTLSLNFGTKSLYGYIVTLV